MNPKLVPTEEPCPECGEPIKRLVRRVRTGRGVAVYVDLYCPSCEWREEDTEGGEE